MGSGFRTEESISHAVAGMGTAWFDDLVRSAWSGGKALFSLLSLLVVAPIVGVYLLIDWDRMIATIDGWVPVPHRENVQALRREIHGTVSGFVRGQATICLILAVLYSAALRSLGLEHAVLIGVSAGLISFVPYLGFGVGFVVATCVATAQFWPDWTRLAEVAAVFLVGESLADYVLSPRMIGSRVRLSPVWVMFSLFAFGYLFGFIGLLVAIPAAASLGVLLRFAMQKSLEGPAPGDASSPLGSGASARGPACPGRERIGPSSREDPAPAHREAAAAWPQAQPEAPWDAGPQNGQADLRAR